VTVVPLGPGPDASSMPSAMNGLVPLVSMSTTR
jgi:hypothetical protein